MWAILEGADASAVRRSVSSVQSHVYCDTLMLSPTVSMPKYKDIGGRPRRSLENAKGNPTSQLALVADNTDFCRIEAF